MYSANGLSEILEILWWHRLKQCISNFFYPSDHKLNPDLTPVRFEIPDTNLDPEWGGGANLHKCVASKKMFCVTKPRRPRLSVIQPIKSNHKITENQSSQCKLLYCLILLLNFIQIFKDIPYFSFRFNIIIVFMFSSPVHEIFYT